MYKVATIGARGYTGLEFVRLVATHPKFQLKTVVSSDASWKVSKEFPYLPRLADVETVNNEKFAELADDFDIIVMALSAQQSFEWKRKLKNFSGVLLDLSGAFRLDQKGAREYYQLELSEEESSVDLYGLRPFQKNNESKLVSNPGCYPTSVLCPLIPLLKEKIIKSDQIIIDAKSGVTGAGRTPKEITHFHEIGSNLVPYKVGNHQHVPEIERFASYFSGREDSLSIRFTTTLVPLSRGILSTLYLKLENGVGEKEVTAAYEKEFSAEKLINFQKLERGGSVSLKKVVGSPMVDINYYIEGDNLTIFSCIDNLEKGAASQAIENLNIRFNLPAHTGLIHTEL
ncbi:MAG: N-acetyl-gamma-glutamyl-phosphate reductase [Halobacteriovoraceae bacterium]|nr:N-acetyl-gamma-glutamyl-phosphate reductase [Halobacteriovoraceae bacterium]|tara:strand:- start:27400 stop:28428 length:1029 start_codon:yes stop_codon:yes gene_type:complete